MFKFLYLRPACILDVYGIHEFNNKVSLNHIYFLDKFIRIAIFYPGTRGVLIEFSLVCAPAKHSAPL